MGARSGSITLPDIPIRSRPNEAMSCSFEAATTLPIEASGPGSRPRDSAVIVRNRVYFRPCVWTSQVARRSRTAGFSIAACPSTSSARAIAIRSSTSGPSTSLAARRSFCSVAIATFQPPFTSPRRWLSGMRTSVKNTSLKSLAPPICLMRCMSMPGVRMSTKKNVRPACLATVGSVRVTSRPKSEKWARDVHIFWPLMIQSSPSRTAFVRSAARSEPAAGSENSWHQISSPRTAAGTKRSICAWVAYAMIVGM